MCAQCQNSTTYYRYYKYRDKHGNPHSLANFHFQALTVASNHHKIVKMDLRSRYLDSLKAIVFKQYNQVSPSVTLCEVASPFSPSHLNQKHLGRWESSPPAEGDLQILLRKLSVTMKENNSSPLSSCYNCIVFYPAHQSLELT